MCVRPRRSFAVCLHLPAGLWRRNDWIGLFRKSDHNPSLPLAEQKPFRWRRVSANARMNKRLQFHFYHAPNTPGEGASFRLPHTIETNCASHYRSPPLSPLFPSTCWSPHHYALSRSLSFPLLHLLPAPMYSPPQNRHVVITILCQHHVGSQHRVRTRTFHRFSSAR